MSVFRESFAKILDYATDRQGLSAEDIKKIRMTNVCCCLEVLNLILVTCTALFYQVYAYLPFLGFQLVGLIACLYYQSQGRYTLAKTVLYLPVLFAVAVSSMGFDSKFQVVVFGFPLTITLFLFFGPRESRVMYTLVYLSVVTLTLGTLIGGYREPIFRIPESNFGPALAGILTLEALILCVLVVDGFFKESYRAERKYIEAAATISEQKERLQAVFDIVEEAIIVVGENGRIQPGFSNFTKSVVNRADEDLIGLNAFDLFISSAHHDRDEIDQCRSALEVSLGAPDMQWDMNKDKILRELEFTFAGQRKVLALNWQPIVKQGIVTALLLMARDITLHRLHDRIRAEQQGRTQVLMGLVGAIMKSSRAIVENFLSKALAKISDLDDENIKEVLFELHTLKGVARSLALQEISVRIHALETSMRTLLPHEVKNRLGHLMQYVENCLELVRELGGSDNSYKMIMHNLYDVASQNLLNIYSLLEKNNLEFEGFTVEDGVLGWRSEVLEAVSTVLLHASTNSIDHGFVFPRQRNQITAGKVRFRLKAWHELKNTVVEISDNGNGVDDETLRKLAEKYELDLSAFANPLDILFESGVSNTVTLSLTSGRGVGTSAIRAVAEKLQGSATILRNPDRGLTIRVTLPRETSLYSSRALARDIV